MLKVWARELDVVLQLVDVAGSALLMAFVLWLPAAVLGRGQLPADQYAVLIAAGALVWPLALQSLRLTRSKRTERVLRMAAQLIGASLVSAVVLSAVAFTFSARIAPWVPTVVAGLQFLVLGGMRLFAHFSLRNLRRTGRNTRSVLIAGSGPRALYIEEIIEKNPSWGLRVIGFIDDEIPDGVDAADHHEVFPVSAVSELLSDQVVDEVIIACPRGKLEEMVAVVDQATEAGIPTTLLSDLFGELLPAPVVRRFGALPALTFAPVHHDAAALAVKRLVDVVGALFGLVTAAPIMGLAALAIRLTDPGPVFFHQVRCSLNGRLFTMPKLRTMRVGAEAMHADLLASGDNEMDGPVFKMQHDPRITPVGRILRKFSLDELPQLWSVLIGDMSLVGPRPAIPHEVAAYRTFERRRLSMRPGLTCLWQVSGRNQIGFDDWVRLDLEYIDTWSLTNDLRILARTIPAVLSGDGAS